MLSADAAMHSRTTDKMVAGSYRNCCEDDGDTPGTYQGRPIAYKAQGQWDIMRSTVLIARLLTSFRPQSSNERPCPERDRWRDISRRV